MNRRKFARVLELLRQQQDVEISPDTTDLFRRACDQHAQRTDKERSLTDRISFTVMAERGIIDSLTSDHQIEQGRFRGLLRDRFRADGGVNVEEVGRFEN